MDAEEFRKRGYETVDRICNYYQNLEKYEVLSKVKPGYLKKLIPEEAPEEPESWDEIKSDIETKIVPGITHWQNPNFLAYFPADSSFPSILGDMYSDMFNVIGFNWLGSPACTELEPIVLEWMAKLIGLDKAFYSGGKSGSVIQSSASEATLLTMLAARFRVYEEYKAKGADEEELRALSTRLVVYGSEQTHFGLNKATFIANTRLRSLPTDDKFSLRGETVKKAIEEDIANGLIPFFIVGTVGTTNCCSVDNLVEIADAIKGKNIWLHIDAAYAGSSLVCPEYHYLLKGINRADSFDFNMHKGLLVNFDCSCLWLKERKYLTSALSVSFDIMENSATESGMVLDYRDWQIPMGRRFRALKIWFVVRTYGAQGLREHVRNRNKLGELFHSKIQSYPELFVVQAAPSFGLVNFYIKSNNPSKNSNELTLKVFNKLNESGRVYVTKTKMKGQHVIRFAPSTATKEKHVNNFFRLLLRITKEVNSTKLSKSYNRSNNFYNLRH